MPGSKDAETSRTVSVDRKELEYLYARRSAIDNLIHSLEEYARFGALRLKKREQQTA